CLANRDTCTNSAKEHRTSDCSNKDPSHCISCNSNDHPSWSRNCPEFNRHCMDLDTRNQDNTLPYFPTDESWT
ncbi:hypothetical protein DFJ58DRAFT_636686, partial [Suillus subalutaceus]|uniref:uncharacterized protein n=1 Tax=Suillus subalutaceus TaxID=48586 RepID=UPI001B8710E1